LGVDCVMRDVGVNKMVGDESVRLLEVVNLSKSFGGVKALIGVSLYARRGEVTSIVGDNGAGKSTLIKCVTGVINADSGEMKIDGKRVSFHSPEEARAAGIETVYQDLSLIPDLRVWENFFLGREIRYSFPFGLFLNRREMRRFVAERLESISVNLPSANAKVRRLSGGQRQAIVVARASVFGSRLIIMDEPTAALGVQETGRVEGVIENLRERGLGIVLISHDMAQVFRLADQVWVLHAGKLAGGGRKVDLSKEDVVAMMTGAVGELAREG